MPTPSLYQRSLESPEPTSVVAQYVWGARPSHRDELVFRERDTNGDGVLDDRLYCLMDYYNPVAVVDTTGEVKERYAWSTFGLRTVLAPGWTPRAESEFDWSFAFHGQFLDDETGYYDYGYRYYSPSLGRWISRDPIGERGGVNLYSFSGNNTVNSLDRFGLQEYSPDQAIKDYLKLGAIEAFQNSWNEFFALVSAETKKASPRSLPFTTSNIFEWGGFVCAICNSDGTYSLAKSNVTKGQNGSWSPAENESLCGSGFPIAIFHSHPSTLGLSDDDKGFIDNPIWNSMGVSVIFSPSLLVGEEIVKNPRPNQRDFVVLYAIPERVSFEITYFGEGPNTTDLNFTLNPVAGLPTSISLDPGGTTAPKNERFGCCDFESHKSFSLREKTEAFRSGYIY